MILTTERLILRPFNMSDLDNFASLMADPEVMRFSISGPMKDLQKVKDYFQSRILGHYDKYGYGLYATILRSNHSFIGGVGLISQCIDQKDKVELAYRLFPNDWGQGFATEAALAMCRYAFGQLKINELISIIDPKNMRSLQVAKRIGMTYAQEASFHGIPVHIYHLKKASQNMSDNVIIRNLCAEDIERLAHTFMAPWSDFETTRKLWQKNFEEQKAGIRTACLLEKGDSLLGYGSLLRSSEYSYFRDNQIPEINAIWIGEASRRQGLGRRLIEHLEALARQEGYKTVGIGVGLYRDYGAAQKLYFKMGYSPDGNGITYKCSPVVPGENYPIDDDLVFWLIKRMDA
jgi:RimJ/RimL family protein N-acetyltransferase